MANRGTACTNTAVSKVEATGKMDALPDCFAPGNWDVICHAGKDIHNHVGNKRFRICIRNHLNSYSTATSRPERSAIISNIVASIRESSVVGGFVRLDKSTKRWYEVGDKVARDKVGQSLRDAMIETNDMRDDSSRGKRKALLAPSYSKPVFKKLCSAPRWEADQKAIELLPRRASRLSNFLEDRLPMKFSTPLEDIQISGPLRRTVSPLNTDNTLFGQRGLLPVAIRPCDLWSTTADSSTSIAMKMIDRRDLLLLHNKETSKTTTTSNDLNHLSLIDWFELDATGVVS